ncbi:4Fe-4S double cluster binding domain-containing protein [Chloroflexota bacterium]
MTDTTLPTGEPVDNHLCEKCTSCVEACLSHAPSGTNWQIGLHRDEFFDAHACRRNAKEITLTRIGIHKSLCGMCSPVCPWTQKYIGGIKWVNRGKEN